MPPRSTPASDTLFADRSSLFDLLPIGAYRSLPDGRLLRVNAALLAIDRCSSEAELLAATHDMSTEWYVDPARRAEFRALLERDGRVLGFVSQVRRLGTGEPIWISENAHVVHDASGAVLYFEGTIEEITARVHAEQALRESEQRWKLALESAGDGVWDSDLATGGVVVSTRLLQMYGLSETERPQRVQALLDRTHPEDLPLVLQARDAHRSGNAAAYVVEHRMRHAQGHWVWVLTRGMVIERDAAGRPLRMIGTDTDISDRREAEQLRRERDRHNAAQKAQSAFLSRVSHELRTPLNAIIGFAQLLEHEGAHDAQDAHDARRARWLQLLLGSGRHLLALVNDLLDLSSAQTGQLQFASAALPLAPLLADAWSMHAASAAAAGLQFECELGDCAALAVLGDATRLKQVLSNLLSNAIKYNRPRGRIHVQATRGRNEVELSISDSGAGIEAAQLERLFTPFERAGAQHSAVAGTGLGLALSRQLVQAMGGELGVRSTPGEGSTFSLRLPLAAGALTGART